MVAMEKNKLRRRYALIFLILLAVEVYIALFVHDRFIRPYVGDVLVVVVLYAFLRILLPTGRPWLVWAVTAFACCVELGQAVGLVDLLGLGHIRFFRVLLGTTFDWHDLLCYLAGGGFVWGLERLESRWEK